MYSCSKNTKQVSVNSPDNNICFKLLNEKGNLFYEVYSDNNCIIKKSGLGFEFKNRTPLHDNLSIAKVEKKSVNESWKPVCGTDSVIANHYNEVAVFIKENGKEDCSMIFIMRAYNDGVAFRYKFPKNKSSDSLYITAENTEFNFANNDSAWWIPSNEFAYESLYRKTLLSSIQDANTPLLIQSKNHYQILLHEAALLDYSEMTLRKTDVDSASFISSLWPEPDSICARASTPFVTPWRCLIIARNPKDIIESHLIQNLNEPAKIKDISWIKPMKFIGIWWGMHIGKHTWYYGPQHGATTERMKKYIDFAAAHHIQGVLAEGWNQGWETWVPGKEMIQNFCKAYPDFDMEEIIHYAHKKNVEFISHHETGGNIPVYEKQMDSAFALCQTLGIHYLKTGYAGTIIPKGYPHHGQYMVRHFQKVVETAAKYQICVDVHECIKPTGLDRTWPNLLTQEGGRGNEWNATYKATPPYHCTILPFTRFVAGPFDYTPCIFNVNHSPESNKRLYCTLSYQLAQWIVFYSPMMMASDMIENYEDQPAFKFIEEAPCTWDATKVIHANPGHFITIARKSNECWYTGTIVNEQSYLLKIPLSFLDKGKKYLAEIYSDSEITNWETNPQSIEINSYEVWSKDTIYAAVSKAGGHCMIIKPMNNANSNVIKKVSDYNKHAFHKMEAFSKIKTFGNFSVEHLALKKDVVLKNSYSNQYPASGKNALIDGVRGTYNYSAGGWQGYEGVDIDASIDLQRQMSVSKISAGFLQAVNDWIFYPKEVEFFISTDGKNYEKVSDLFYSIKPTDASNNNIFIKDFSVSLTKKNVRYIHIIATNIRTCPDWHPGKGKKAWLFCDEIIVN